MATIKTDQVAQGTTVPDYDTNFHYEGKVIHKVKFRKWLDEYMEVNLDRLIELGIIKPIEDLDDEN